MELCIEKTKVMKQSDEKDTFFMMNLSRE